MSLVVVEPYNPEWPQYFQQINSELKKYLQDAPYISIEHVGSTAVPGLAAKSIIDIDIIVARDNVHSVVDALVNRGKFDWLGELGVADRHVVRDPNQSPLRNIYVCVDGAAQTRNHIGLRDTLRSNVELRDEYAQVKLALAAAGTNILDYIEGKGAIIRKILKASGMLTLEEIAAFGKPNPQDPKWAKVKTERLVLREFTTMDSESYYVLESNEANARYQDWPPRTKEQALELVFANMRNIYVVPRTSWELIVESGGCMIGRVGAALKRLEHETPPLNHFDLWFSFLPSVQGKGFATEAVTALIDELVKKYDKDSIELEIECDPRNTGCLRLAERLGFEKHSLTERAWESKGEWVDSLVYRKMIARSHNVCNNRVPR
jgi:GrpB-like predicted nucleotidyltransferase (UPF0157 family)/RimJ/RimL family protein N-acetyltransferase